MTERPDAPERSASALAAAVSLYAAVALVFAALGRPNIDEGIFLGAGRRVASGQVPYRDFPFSQAPLLPYAFAAAPDWFDSALHGGRALAFAAAVLGASAALWIAQRVAGGLAAAIALLMTFATLPLLWVGTTIRAQALGTPLLLLGVAALAIRQRGVWSWAAAPSLLLWSSGMRLTNVGVFAAVTLWVVWRLRRAPARLLGVAALLAAQALVIAAPVLRAPEPALFQIFTAQLTRGERFGYVVSLPFPENLLRRLDGYLPLAWDAWLLLVFAIPLAAAWLVQTLRGLRPSLTHPFGDPHSAQLALGALALIAFAPHLHLGNSFLEYLVPLWALLAPAVGIGVAESLRRRGTSAGLGAAFAATLAGVVAVWGLATSDVWIGRGAASFEAFHRAGETLEGLAGPDCSMLTLETELALEARCRPTAGLAYSYFAYFPELPSAEARRVGVANLALLRARVAADPPALIVLAPSHPYILLGRSAAERARVERSARVAPLAFLGDLARLYRPWEPVTIASGIRRPGQRDTVTLRVYRRAGGPGP